MKFTKKMKKALKHGKKLGAGAKARKGLKGQSKVAVVMHEFKRGTLHSSDGSIVKDRRQALAIALSEAGLNKKKSGKKRQSVKSNSGTGWGKWL